MIAGQRSERLSQSMPLGGFAAVPFRASDFRPFPVRGDSQDPDDSGLGGSGSGLGGGGGAA